MARPRTKPEIKSIFAKHIRYERETMRGLSREEFADEVGVTSTAIAIWELETFMPSFESLILLYRRLGIEFIQRFFDECLTVMEIPNES